MRKVALIGTAIAFAMTATAWAGAKDKTSQTFVDIDAAGVINNTTAKTKTKSKGCKLQAQMKDVTMADGEIAICIAEADVLGIGGNSLILTGEAKKGKLKIKADISEATILGSGCGSVEAISYNGSMTCYLDDPTYRLNTNVPGSWREACGLAGMLAGDGPGATFLKANPTVPVVIGICQGFVEGDRIGPPSSTRFAVQGQRTAVE
jgi:hypothetical protein